MITKPTERTYKNGELEVLWQPAKCIHSKICWNGLEEVFNPNRRPWVDLNAADQETIMKQVDQCPSGALSYSFKGQSPKATAGAISIQVLQNGPLLINGNCTVNMPDGSAQEQEGSTALCRCGASANKPFCDGQHKKIGFEG